jgi:hypothetical protein
VTGDRNSGSCLCGACRFTAVPEQGLHACHCGNCRKWSGGVFLSVHCGTSVEFNADAPLVRYPSSDYAERVFCGRCGSSLVWEMRDGSVQIVSIQAFDDPGAFPFESQIYVDHKPQNYDFANRTEMMTEAEVIAKYTTQGGESA